MFLTKFLTAIARHPWFVAFILLATTLLAVWSTTGIQFDFAPQSLFNGRDDLVATSEDLHETFGGDAPVMQVILQAITEPDVLEPEALNWQVRFAREMEQLPNVVSVQSLGSITTRRFSLVGSFGMVREPLISLPADEITEAEVRDFLDRSYLTQGTLVSEDREVAAILVFFDAKLRSQAEMRTIVDRVQASVAQHPAPEGYRVRVAGEPVLRVDIVRNLQKDQRSLLPLAGVIYFIALILVYRRVSGSLVPLIAVGIGLAWCLGVMAATGQSFNLISNVLPILLIVLGVSNSVHIISRYTHQVPLAPSREVAVIHTMHHMTIACLLTFLTTAAGFASLMTAHSNVLRAFGWQAVLGLILLYGSIVLTLTAALPYLRPPAVTTRIAGRRFSLKLLLGKLANVVNHRPKLILVCSLLLMGAACVAARDVKINSSRMETYDPIHPTMQTLRLVERELSGLFPLEVDLHADDPETFYQADTARKLAEFRRFALKRQDVVFARSYLDIHAEVEPSLRELLAEVPPATFSDLQGTLDSSQVRVRSAESELGYAAFMTVDRKRARILMKIRDEGTYKTQELIDALEKKLGSLFPDGSGVRFQLTGSSYVNTFAMNQLVRELLASLVGASGVIFVIIVVLFRSFRVGLLAVLPNATPLVLTVGYMGWRGYDMNASNVIVFAIALGIAVDDTIHFLFRFREEHKRESDAAQATSAALQGTGPAMILTSFLIVVGLAVLMFSQFVPTRRFAELLIVTMAGALVGDLLLLPACLILFCKKTDLVTEESDTRTEEETLEPLIGDETASPDELVSESPS